MRRRVRVAEIGMFVRVPRMKLRDYFSVPHNLFVLGSAVTALAIEQPLVPAAARSTSRTAMSG